jgi:hypothetical protein
MFKKPHKFEQSAKNLHVHVFVNMLMRMRMRMHMHACDLGCEYAGMCVCVRG